jgi:SAM-dependent methyltransferase
MPVGIDQEVVMRTLSELKQNQRQMWATGDFPSMVEKIASVGVGVVERTGVKPGEDVLDVACGTGNAARPAARAGARVTGLDLTPELLDAGRREAAEEGVEVSFVEGDAESLPFEDASFDVVLSTFGCMFAPDHAAAASEIARVLRPGGRIGLANWTPEGEVGDFFRTVAQHAPPPPEVAESPPLLWGTEQHVLELFAGKGIDFEFGRRNVRFAFDSADDSVVYFETKFGPVIKARERLEPEGRWQALRDDLLRLFERHDVGEGDDLEYDSEYLVVLGRKS